MINNKIKEQKMMKKATFMAMVAVLIFATAAFAETGNRGKFNAFSKTIAPEDAAVVSAYVEYRAPERMPRLQRSSLIKSALVTSYNLPATSVYDYGWNSGIRDYVAVDATGDVHVTVFIRPSEAVNDRHVVYWYNPGQGVPGAETFVDPVTSDGSGWSSIQTFADGRASIVYHIDDFSFLVDVFEGFGLFTLKAAPIAGPVWMHHQITNDDKVWYATNRWSVFPGDSTRVWSSTDEGSNWTEATVIDVSGTHSGGSAEPVVRVSQDGSEALVKMEYVGISNVTADSADMSAYWTTSDGVDWTRVVISFDPYETSVADTTLIADVFMSAVGTADTLIIENFGQIDITYDYQGNVHAIMNGYSFNGWFLDTMTVCDSTGCALDSTYINQFAWPLLHYSSVRGEGAANFVEVTDPAVSHSDALDELIADDTDRWAVNNIGIGYPTIAAATDGPNLLVVWLQPEGGVTPDTSLTGNGFMSNDLYLSTSGNGGDTWSSPKQITDTPGLSERFPTLAKPLISTGNANEYEYHLVYMEDEVAGSWLHVQSDSGNAQWVYMTGTEAIVITPPPIGVEDGNVVSAKSFELEQNYPNPFNPETRIDFALDTKSEVNLTIFNVLGQEVATLVNNEVKAAGNHNVTWNASDVASGVYFYKLTAGDLSLTKKMVLLK